MFTYRVPNNGDPDALDFAELRVQCVLANQAYDQLSAYCRIVDTRSNGRICVGASPSNVIAQCVGFLSAVAVVSKILFPADKNAACRGERLRKRLALGDLPEIASRSVRNAYEHIDEKIDVLRVPDADTQIWLMDTNEEACGDPIVLKRFDPVSRTIQFLGNKLDLEVCKAEIVLVERSL